MICDRCETLWRKRLIPPKVKSLQYICNPLLVYLLFVLNAYKLSVMTNALSYVENKVHWDKLNWKVAMHYNKIQCYVLTYFTTFSYFIRDIIYIDLNYSTISYIRILRSKPGQKIWYKANIYVNKKKKTLKILRKKSHPYFFIPRSLLIGNVYGSLRQRDVKVDQCCVTIRMFWT